MNVIQLKSPYLIFLGDVTSLTYAKTGSGLAQWRPELCAGQLSLVANGVDLGLQPMTIADAKAHGVRSLVIGVASIGGEIKPSWESTFVEAAEAGLDIVAGLHQRLGSYPGLAEAAQSSGANLIDIRQPPENLPIADGQKRSGKRLLTVGTDCAVGKKYTALALEKAMRAEGMNATFRASGQTGIMIAGKGLPIDAVVADFISGAAELLSPDNEPDHWDIVEGQGAITHPAYAAVTAGLLLGSQPDAFVVCHEAGRDHISGWESYALHSINDIIARTMSLGSITNPNIHCVGVSVNTSALDSAKRRSYLDELETELGLPCVDPLIDGVAPIVARLSAAASEVGAIATGAGS